MPKEIPTRIRVPAALTFAAFIIIIAGVMYASSIIISLLMAIFIGIVCYQPIIWLKRKKVPNGIAIALVFIGIFAVVFGLGEVIGTSLSSFSDNLPKYEKNLDAFGAGLLDFLGSMGFNVSTEKMSSLFEPSKIMNLTANILGQLGGFMGNALTVFFLALFLLLEVEAISLKTKAILKGTTYSLDYLNKIGNSIRHYLSIKTLISLLTGLLVWISLAIIGVDYAIIWALVAFLLNYIPNFGSIIAGVPPALFALVQLGFGGMLWTIGAFVAINMVIGNAVEPKVMGKGMGLSTFVVFLALIFWGFVLGTVGMFLSIPLTMAIKIMLEQNPGTKWIAVLLSSPEDARALLGADKE